MQRLDPKSVASQDQLVAAFVNECEGEHPVQAGEGIESPLFVGVNDDLCIAQSPKLMTA